MEYIGYIIAGASLLVTLAGILWKLSNLAGRFESAIENLIKNLDEQEKRNRESHQKFYERLETLERRTDKLEQTVAIIHGKEYDL